MTPRLTVFASSSAGNCSLVECGEARVLIDCGISVRQIIRRLQTIDLNPYDIDAMLLTHEHGDHVSSLTHWIDRFGTKIVCTQGTGDALGIAHLSGATVKIGGLEIEAVPIPHDAAEPCGFVFNETLAFFTDLGSITPTIRARIRGVEELAIESNHDERMVYADESRPWRTKQRVLSRTGHLSNGAAASLIGELAGGPLRKVTLLHLSTRCNTPEIARETAWATINGAGIDLEVIEP